MPNPNEPAAPAAPAPGAPAAATTPPEPAANPAQPSLLAGAGEQPPAVNGDDWLPEKFRVVGEDGALDQAASARKLAESYRALEAHKGPALVAPATPGDYKLTAPVDAEGKPVEGIDVEAFAQDPLFQGLAARAHAKGIPNEHMDFFVQEYLQFVPGLVEAQTQATSQASTEEARAELSKLWADDATMRQNLAGVVRAINAFGTEGDDLPGSPARLLEKYGNDPDFAAFAARVAGELKEDQPPAGAAGVNEALDIEALQASEAYWKPEHPEHAKVKAKVDAYYAKKHGTQPRRGSIAAA